MWHTPVYLVLRIPFWAMYMFSSAHVITYDINKVWCPYKFAVGYVIKFDGIKSPYICPKISHQAIAGISLGASGSCEERT